jgi:hypothetical protein
LLGIARKPSPEGDTSLPKFLLNKDSIWKLLRKILLHAVFMQIKVYDLPLVLASPVDISKGSLFFPEWSKPVTLFLIFPV